MEMESLPTQDHTETVEPGPSSAPPSYRDAQVWKDLEAETGFASCADYMDYYKDVRPDFKERLKQFQKLRATYRTPAFIYDLSKQEDLPISLSLRRPCHSGTELIQALREPPGNVGVQLVLCFHPSFFNQEMADALILGLKLDPRLLEVYTYVKLPPRSKDVRTSQIARVVGNGTVTTLSQNFMPGEATAVPVLLVVSDVGNWEPNIMYDAILAGGDGGKPPFHRPRARENKPFRAMEGGVWGKKGQTYANSYAKPYAEAVERFIEQDRLAIPSKAFLLLAAMSPLLHIEAYRVREASDHVRSTYDKLTRDKIAGQDTSATEHKGLDQDLDRQRLKLRRTLEKAEDYVSDIFMYLGSEAHLDWSKERSYKGIQADWRRFIDEERRLEIEVRDYMQIQVGNLALEESRRSIELSNLQIQESKSGKL